MPRHLIPRLIDAGLVLGLGFLMFLGALTLLDAIAEEAGLRQMSDARCQMSDVSYRPACGPRSAP